MRPHPVEIRVERDDEGVDGGGKVVVRPEERPVPGRERAGHGRPGAASRRSTGTSRLFFSTACASSCAQTSEASESGVITKRKLSEDSMPRYTSNSHSAVIGMSSQSAQMSLSCAASAAYSSRTNSTSRRE